MSIGHEIIKQWEAEQERGSFHSYKISMDWLANAIDTAIKQLNSSDVGALPGSTEEKIGKLLRTTYPKSVSFTPDPGPYEACEQVRVRYGWDNNYNDDTKPEFGVWK